MRKSLFAALMVSFGGVCALLFVGFYRDAKRAAIANLDVTQMIHAKQAARGLEDFFATWTSTLAALSKMDEIVAANAEGRRAMKLFCDAHHDQIRSITRMDERGVILATYPFVGVEGSDITGQEHVREILRDHVPVVSEVFTTVQGFKAVALHVPVFKGTEFKGSIAAVIDFESLARRYLDVIRIGRTGYAWVISRNGTILYTPIPGLTGRSALEEFKGLPSLSAMVRSMLQEREGAATYMFDRVRGQTVGPVRKYGVYMPVRLDNTFWSIAVASTEPELLASLNSFRNRLALIIGLTYVGGMLLSVVAVKAWLIVKEEDRRKRAEETLRESEQHYRLLFDRNPAPMLIYDRESLQLLAVNEAFQRHYGYGKDEALALRLPDLYPEEEKAGIVALIARLGGYAYAGEWHHRRKDGSLMTIVATSHDILYLDHKARIAVITDITERKNAEDALRISEQKFMKAFHATPDAIVISRVSDGRLMEVNEVFLRETGYTREEVQGRTTLELGFWAEPDDRERYAAAVRANGRVREMEARFRMRDGVVLDGLVSGESIALDGEPCLLTIIRDVTERKRTEGELEHYRLHLEELVEERTTELAVARDRAEAADRLKSAFLAIMSHELRTPLNSIIGFTGILLQGLAGPLNPEQRKQMNMVRESARHLLDLINDILDLSKIEAGQLQVSREAFDLRGAIERAARCVTPLAQEKKLSLAVRVAPELPQAVGDRRRVEQVLINLLTNAIKFTETGGVTLAAEVVQGFVSPSGGGAPGPGEAARISIEDTGIGIKPEDLPSLFRPFHQLDNGLTRQREGTGLGLAICRRLADLMGAGIAAESRWGAGSTFTFTLPIERP